MPQWLIEIISKAFDNPLVLTAIGTAFIYPVTEFLAKLAIKKSPPPNPVAYDISKLPENPILLAGKVSITDDDMQMLKDIKQKLSRIEDQLDFANDRLGLLLRK